MPSVPHPRLLCSYLGPGLSYINSSCFFCMQLWLALAYLRLCILHGLLANLYRLTYEILPHTTLLTQFNGYLPSTQRRDNHLDVPSYL